MAVISAQALDAHALDWRAIEALPEFRELVARRRRFVVPATAFYLAWYFAFIVAAGYAPDTLGKSVYQGLTVGYVWALTQFAMVWILGLWYLRYSARVLDPLRERVVACVAQMAGSGEPGREPRFHRGERTTPSRREVER
jgi:uncharacterized membrane protein (DUF485 family)